MKSSEKNFYYTAEGIAAEKLQKEYVRTRVRSHVAIVSNIMSGGSW